MALLISPGVECGTKRLSEAPSSLAAQAIAIPAHIIGDNGNLWSIQIQIHPQIQSTCIATTTFQIKIQIPPLLSKYKYKYKHGDKYNIPALPPLLPTKLLAPLFCIVSPIPRILKLDETFLKRFPWLPKTILG